MGRKSEYDKLVEKISKQIRAMAPENCDSIEQVLANDKILADAGLAAPSTAADYTICANCGHPAYHGICRRPGC
jgi:hypothetical protein